MSNDQDTAKIAPITRGAVDDPSWNSEQMPQEEQDRKAEADRVLDPVESMKDRHDTKNLTLAEIKVRDEENLRLVLATSRQHTFSRPDQAINFTFEMLAKALVKLGVTKAGVPCAAKFLFMRDIYKGALTLIPGNLYTPDLTPNEQNIIKRQMIDNDVRFEIRQPQQYPKEDQWKSGMYLYHGSEIAFFISNPIADKNAVSGGGHIVLPQAFTQRWFVKTNVPTGMQI